MRGRYKTGKRGARQAGKTIEAGDKVSARPCTRQVKRVRGRYKAGKLGDFKAGTR